jgi:hypothetical protein
VKETTLRKPKRINPKGKATSTNAIPPPTSTHVQGKGRNKEEHRGEVVLSINPPLHAQTIKPKTARYMEEDGSSREPEGQEISQTQRNTKHKNPVCKGEDVRSPRKNKINNPILDPHHRRLGTNTGEKKRM